MTTRASLTCTDCQNATKQKRTNNNEHNIVRISLLLNVKTFFPFFSQMIVGRSQKLARETARLAKIIHSFLAVHTRRRRF